MAIVDGHCSLVLICSLRYPLIDRRLLPHIDNNEAKYEYGDVGLTIFDLDSFNDHYECVPAITETNTYYSLLYILITMS